MPDAKQLTFIDFFSGVGGFRHGLELAGMKCVGFCEKDAFAVRSYRAMYDTEGEWYGNDITELSADDVPKADIWTAGSPCQNVSIAGRRAGLHGDRSGLFFDFVDLLKGKAEENKPRWIILENVKGLLASNAGWDFLEYLCELDEAGYNVQWQVFNSKDYGIPQNRERVYAVGRLRSRGGREILPIGAESYGNLKQIVGGMQGYRVYDPSGVSSTLASEAGGMGAKTGLYLIDQSLTAPKITEEARCITARYTSGTTKRTAMNSAVLEIGTVFPVLTPDRIEKRQNGRRIKSSGEPMFTLTSRDRHGVMLEICVDTDNPDSGQTPRLKQTDDKIRLRNAYQGFDNVPSCSGLAGAMVWNGRLVRIRRLTPRECFRLQGFSDELFDRAAAVNSDAQLYKQAGNGVTVNVVYAIGRRIAEMT
jgi:DNA (cytosine-5)-methyltransferase 1